MKWTRNWFQVKVKMDQKKNQFHGKGNSFHSKKNRFQLKRNVASTSGKYFLLKRKVISAQKKVAFHTESKEN